MGIPFRIIDTGVRDGRHQIAFDEALIECHRTGRSPDTVRFLRFPPTVLIGRHQAMRHEVKVEHCQATGIGLVRRITGGGAIYLDEGQAGWEIVLSRRRLPLPTLGDYTRAICEAVAHGLSKAFGIEARFRPRNDIEVGGRKLCGTGGFFDGDTLIYQGTVLIDADPARVLGFLNVPAAESATRDLDRAETRLTTLKELLGGEVPDVFAVHQAVLLGLSAKLGIEPRHGMPTDAEEALAKGLHADPIGTDAFTFLIDDPGGAGILAARRPSPGGTLAAYVRLEGAGGARRIREVLLTGDFFVTPPRVVFDLEAALRGVLIANVGATVDRFFEAARADVMTISPALVRDTIAAALASDAKA